MENPTDQIVAELEHAHPGFQVWVIHRAVGGQIWCARRHGEDTAAFNASSPEELAELIEQEAER
jgi:hypothetical protein